MAFHEGRTRSEIYARDGQEMMLHAADGFESRLFSAGESSLPWEGVGVVRLGGMFLGTCLGAVMGVLGGISVG